jgi:uncharacterized repeat protein (TIGR02543 family)
MMSDVGRSKYRSEGKTDKSRLKIIIASAAVIISLLIFLFGDNVLERAGILTSSHSINSDEFDESGVITVSFDNSAGDFTYVAPKTVTVGSEYGAFVLPIKRGYVFLGWFNSDGARITATTTVTSNTNHTLYARWKLIED